MKKSTTPQKTENQPTKGNDSNYKTGVIVGLSILGVFAAYKIFSGVNNAIDSVLDPDISDTVSGTGGSTENATITNAQAANYAQQLLDAMNEGRDSWFLSGTDEEAILSVFNKLKTSGDFVKVFNAFGLKDYDGYESPPTDGVWNWTTVYQERNLVYWLSSELEPGDGRVYNVVKSRVEGAGFAFK